MWPQFFSLRCDSKTSTNFFSLLCNFTDRKFILTVDLSNLRQTYSLANLSKPIVLFFFFLSSQELSPFSLKGNTFWQIQIASNTTLVLWGHDMWGLLEHKHCDTTGQADLITKTETKWLMGGIHRTKGRVTSRGVRRRTGQHCISLPRMARNLKLMHRLLLELSI